MSFRLKILLTLLGFSLLPLLLVSFVNLRSLWLQGRKYTNTTRDELSEIVRSELRYTVEDFALNLKKGERSLWFALSLLTENAQEALTGQTTPPTQGNGGRFFFGQDFLDRKTAPEDLAPLPQLHELAASGSKNLARASVAHPAFLAAPGTRRTADPFRRQMPALASLQPLQRELFQQLESDAYRQIVCLESGLCSVYPGHGGFGEDFDGRKQEWYVQTRKTNKAGWTGPLTDPVFEAPVYVLGMPLHDDAGTFLGVAALDYPLSHLLQEQRLTSKWSDAMRSYAVAVQQDPETGKKGLVTFARRDYENVSTPSDSTPNYAWLRSSDAEAYAELLHKMAATNSGVMELPLEGRDTLWAFARYDDFEGLPIYLMLTLPKSVFMELPDSFATQAMDLLRSQGIVALVALLLAAGLVTVVAVMGARSVTRPMMQVSDAARRLSEGDFSVHLDLDLKDERQQLVRVINELGPRLAQYMEMQQAMQVAEEVQKSLLPSAAPSVPGFDISGASIYCDLTGGDYYDFIQEPAPPTDHCMSVIGDVSGHGIPSALLMATARALLRGLMALPASLAERVTLVNSMLSQDLNGSGRFMTLFIIELDPASDELRWVRAGHDPALLYDPRADSFRELAGSGMPLGVVEDYVYEQFAETCSVPGSVIVMGTDGIWETMAAGSSDHSRMFGKERLQQVVRANAHRSAAGIQQTVLQAVADYRGQNRQSDDITLTVIKKL